jgi:hypothetical protein
MKATLWRLNCVVIAVALMLFCAALVIFAPLAGISAMTVDWQASFERNSVPDACDIKCRLWQR